jgi:drug/metabolite transporter (DMT)-like permease
VLLNANANGAPPLSTEKLKDSSSGEKRFLSNGSLHTLGVLCGLTAGVWLGGAEAPTKLVSAGISPFAISFCMVLGVFTARWSFPTMLKGTSYVFADLRSKKHLLTWAILAGALWAVANTLTVFAIRDIGLAIAFPLWNTNSLIGLLWGRVLFRELDGADRSTIAKVVVGAVCIVTAATLLGFSTLHGGTGIQHGNAIGGILAALGAGLLWGTMYIPYRKAYLSGMNPLSFVTIFTVGELLTMFALIWFFDGGSRSSVFHLAHARPYIFWLFLGGSAWVVGDMFQQFAAKYIGIGRGIPLSNTNQLWGLAWGALVFGELAGSDAMHKAMVISGSAIMILGALLISAAKASGTEHTSRNEAMERECIRYGMDYQKVMLAQDGEEPDGSSRRRWWDYAILLAATAIFVRLAFLAAVPQILLNFGWAAFLLVILALSLVACGYLLYRRTRFS